VANLADLPNGVFVKFAEEPYLVYNDWLLGWSAGGYTKRMDRPHNAEVIVLTPNSTVAAIRAGYVPEIHTSANRSDEHGQKTDETALEKRQGRPPIVFVC
jgi:hypothetical protein